MKKEKDEMQGSGRKKFSAVYIAAFLAICLVPFAGMLAGRGGASTAREEQAQLPSFVKDDGGVNLEVLHEAGEWFESNFGLRQYLVTAYAKLEAGLFHTSASPGVILGREGWLYYKDSLADYQGTDLLSDRAIYDIAHTARMTQDYCGLLGVQTLFAIAPNKATLYPEYMPRYYPQGRNASANRIRLSGYMKAEGVDYLDLTEVLKEAEPEASPWLYHRTDSHWTAEGAAAAADEILNRLSIPHRDYADAAYTVRTDFEGDLAQMLYPAAVTAETEVSYDPAPSYGYIEDVESTFDFYIHTVSGGEGGSAVVYRDSFGNAILPFLAEAWQQAYFTRGTPYTLTDLVDCQASEAVFLRAERFLPDIAEQVPVWGALPSEKVPDEEGLREVGASVTSAPEEAQPYYRRIQGFFTDATGEKVEPGERIYVEPGDGLLYEAMPVCEDGVESFILYMPEEYAATLSGPEEIRVYLEAPDEEYAAQSPQHGS